jgi:hypothetical protein
LVSDWASATFTPTTSSLKLNGGTAALNITHGQSVSVSDSVTGTSGTPTGNIALVDSLSPANNPNNEGIAGFTLASGSATGTTTALPGGSYNVSAHYGGSSTFGQSDSNSIPVTVAAESSTTTLTVAGIYDPATFNQVSTPYYGFIYLIDAQPYGNSASAANPNGAATGTITFKSGSTTLGTAPLASDGIAELQTVALPGGNDSLTAAFPGDASFKANTSAAVPFSVTPAVTTLTAPKSQPIDGTIGSPITLSVTLSVDSAGIAPTGTVTFMNGSASVGTAPMVGAAATATGPAGGTASLSTNNLPVGNSTITAVYSGDPNYGGSTSPSTPVDILQANTSLTISPASPTFKINQALQLTVTPARISGLPVPTGTVSVFLNTLLVPAVTLVNGVANITIPANTFPLGSSNVNVQYNGDTDYAQVNANLPITVNSAGSITPTIKVVPPAGTANFPISTTVTISGPSGDPVPTGTVTLTSPNLVNTATGTLTNGSVVLTITYAFEGGPQTLTATYSGDDNYTPGTASANLNVISQTTINYSVPPVIAATQPFSLPVSIAGGYTTLTTGPTGTITLTCGSYTSPQFALTAGSATITVPANSLPVGVNETLNINYSGDTNYAPNTSSRSVTVTPGPPGLTLAALPLTVTPGSTTGNTVAVTVTPSNGFTGSVALTATLASSPSGAQDLPTLSFGTTSPVSITGTTAGTATLTITTTAPSTTAFAHPALPGIRWYQGGAALACLLLFGIPARRRRLRTLLGMFAFLTFLTTGLISCGGGGGGGGGGTGPTNPGTTPGAYVISVTGTQGAITATTNVTLTVQ